MKLINRIALAVLLLAALAPAARADFLVVSIRESTIENFWRWLVALSGLFVLVTLNKSRREGGNGN